MPRDAPNTARDLLRSSSDILILSILADGPSHGYAIQKQLRLSLGQTLPAASLYPLLHQIEAAGLITSEADNTTARTRKRYTLTPAGRSALRKKAAEWQASIARLQSLVLPAVRRIATR